MFHYFLIFLCFVFVVLTFALACATVATAADATAEMDGFTIVASLFMLLLTSGMATFTVFLIQSLSTH